ncbi:MAG: 50S ribosomal protein L25 [Ignavibacteriales bacterium]|nr:50S ribosomal protein L25 [Ignavibacteriales bacterium]
MSDINITAKKRTKSTKGAVNKIRREGNVPGILYSKGSEPVNIFVEELSLKPVVYTSEVHLVNLKIEDQESVRSILKDIQFDPLTDRIVHVDFQAVTLGKAIQLQLPISFIGSAVGVKEGGKLQQNLHKLDIQCLPKDIPQHLEVDITNLHIGNSILVGDLSFENIEILSAADTVVVSVTTIKETTDEKTDELQDAPKEPELISRGKAQEDSEG